MLALSEMIPKLSGLGEAKVRKPLGVKIVLAIFAGALVSFGYVAYIKVVFETGGAYAHLIGSMLFPIGIICILGLGMELVTSNTVLVALACLSKRVSKKEMLVNWITVFFFNLIGAALVAFLMIYLGTFDSVKEEVTQFAYHKAELDFMRTVVSGIACNIFVGMGTWLYLAGKDGFSQLLGVWFPIMIFVLCGYQHSVANGFVLTLGYIWDGLTLPVIFLNLSAALIGNAIGGSFVLAFLLYYINQKLAVHHLA